MHMDIRINDKAIVQCNKTYLLHLQTHFHFHLFCKQQQACFQGTRYVNQLGFPELRRNYKMTG